MLKKTLQELELKQAKLKFNQPVSTTRCCWPRSSWANQATTLGGNMSQQAPQAPPQCSHTLLPHWVSELPAVLLAEHPQLPLGSQSSLSPRLEWGVLPAACSWAAVGAGGTWIAFGAALGCPCTPLQLCNVSVAGSRLQEEELRENLKREEARLEQMRAQMLKSQKRLIEFENIIDNLFLRLQGIVIPGQVRPGHQGHAGRAARGHLAQPPPPPGPCCPHQGGSVSPRRTLWWWWGWRRS